jgi:queuine tRNA-ribosyltransferase
MFDCVLPTRLARHGTVLTSEGRVQMKNARFARDPGPLDPACSCETCSRYSRAYLRHLQMVGEQTVATLLTIHNLTYLLDLMRRARQAILDGTFAAVRAETAATWQ